MTAPSVPAGDVAKLVEELRTACIGHPHATIAWPHRILHRAADALEASTREVADLRAALKPFAAAIKQGAQVQYLTADGWIGDLTDEATQAARVLATPTASDPAREGR